jgi:hypothetical protein
MNLLIVLAALACDDVAYGFSPGAFAEESSFSFRESFSSGSFAPASTFAAEDLLLEDILARRRGSGFGLASYGGSSFASQFRSRASSSSNALLRSRLRANPVITREKIKIKIKERRR